MYKTHYFSLQELTCPHVFNKYKDAAWNFFDPRLLITLDWLRERLGKPILVNNWATGGQFTQRGLRCNLCNLVKDKTLESTVYLSSHILGKAVDFDVQGMKAEDVRHFIVNNLHTTLPYPVCLEDAVSWVHLDMRDKDKKVYLFRA